ncbi:hypothetical protein Efla_004328 [Eimeria flavescens]
MHFSQLKRLCNLYFPPLAREGEDHRETVCIYLVILALLSGDVAKGSSGVSDELLQRIKDQGGKPLQEIETEWTEQLYGRHEELKNLEWNCVTAPLPSLNSQRRRTLARSSWWPAMQWQPGVEAAGEAAQSLSSSYSECWHDCGTAASSAACVAVAPPVEEAGPKILICDGVTLKTVRETWRKNPNEDVMEGVPPGTRDQRDADSYRVEIFVSGRAVICQDVVLSWKLAVFFRLLTTMLLSHEKLFSVPRILEYHSLRNLLTGHVLLHAWGVRGACGFVPNSVFFARGVEGLVAINEETEELERDELINWGKEALEDPVIHRQRGELVTRVRDGHHCFALFTHEDQGSECLLKDLFEKGDVWYQVPAVALMGKLHLVFELAAFLEQNVGVFAARAKAFSADVRTWGGDGEVNKRDIKAAADKWPDTILKLLRAGAAQHQLKCVVACIHSKLEACESAKRSEKVEHLSACGPLDLESSLLVIKEDQGNWSAKAILGGGKQTGDTLVSVQAFLRRVRHSLDCGVPTAMRPAVLMLCFGCGSDGGNSDRRGCKGSTCDSCRSDAGEETSCSCSCGCCLGCPCCRSHRESVEALGELWMPKHVGRRDAGARKAGLVAVNTKKAAVDAAVSSSTPTLTEMPLRRSTRPLLTSLLERAPPSLACKRAMPRASNRGIHGCKHVRRTKEERQRTKSDGLEGDGEPATFLSSPALLAVPLIQTPFNMLMLAYSRGGLSRLAVYRAKKRDQIAIQSRMGGLKAIMLSDLDANAMHRSQRWKTRLWESAPYYRQILLKLRQVSALFVQLDALYIDSARISDSQ